MAAYENLKSYVVQVESADELANDIYDLVAKETNVERTGRQLYSIHKLHHHQGEGELYEVRFGVLVDLE